MFGAVLYKIDNFRMSQKCQHSLIWNLKSVHYYLALTHWKYQFCLIWTLKKGFAIVYICYLFVIFVIFTWEDFSSLNFVCIVRAIKISFTVRQQFWCRYKCHCMMILWQSTEICSWSSRTYFLLQIQRFAIVFGLLFFDKKVNQVS